MRLFQPEVTHILGNTPAPDPWISGGKNPCRPPPAWCSKCFSQLTGESASEEISGLDTADAGLIGCPCRLPAGLSPDWA